MFKLITLQDTIRIPPETFGNPLEAVGREQVKTKYEGVVDEELGYVIAVTGVEVSPTGKIIPGDGATFHKVNFSLLTFYPLIQEIVEGDVVEIADFGAFVRIGPVDALLHVSQLMDDFISYDEKQGVLLGKETKRKLSSLAALSTVRSMKQTPRAPSYTVGKSSSSSVGSPPWILARIVSVALRYTLAKASMKASGWPVGRRVARFASSHR